MHVLKREKETYILLLQQVYKPLFPEYAAYFTKTAACKCTSNEIPLWLCIVFPKDHIIFLNMLVLYEYSREWRFGGVAEAWVLAPCIYFK